MSELGDSVSKTKDQSSHTDKYSEGWSLAYIGGKLTTITYPNGSTAEISYADDQLKSVKLPDDTVWTKPKQHSELWYEGNSRNRDTLGAVTLYDDGRITVKNWKTAKERTWYSDGTVKSETPELTGDELQVLFKSALPQIDANKDGQLSKTELKNAILAPHIKGTIARFAAVAYRSFDDLSSLNWQYPGIEPTIDSTDIDVYAAYSQPKKEDWSKLLGPVNPNKPKIENIYQKLISTDERNRHRNLYSRAGGSHESIKSKFVKQGSLKDCYFHAALAAVAEVRPDLIKKMIHDNKDGTYNVTFADDAKHPLRVKALTESEKMLYGSTTEGGLWPLLIEKAYGEQIRKDCTNVGLGLLVKDLLPSELSDFPGQTERVLNKITGQKHETVILPLTGEDVLDAKLKSAYEQHIPMTCGTRIADIRPRLAELESLHAFSILSYDHFNKLVTIRNPHGNDEVNYQGTFTMTLKQFKDNFTDLYLASQPKSN